MAESRRYGRAALVHGLEVPAGEEPVREQLDGDDWDPPELPEPDRAPDCWRLMPFVLEAT